MFPEVAFELGWVVVIQVDKGLAVFWIKEQDVPRLERWLGLGFKVVLGETVNETPKVRV